MKSALSYDSADLNHLLSLPLEYVIQFEVDNDQCTILNCLLHEVEDCLVRGSIVQCQEEHLTRARPGLL